MDFELAPLRPWWEKGLGEKGKMANLGCSRQPHRAEDAAIPKPHAILARL